MLVSKTVEEFVEELASSSPAPGGGSVAALAGALGGGLTAMVCNLTIGSPKYIDVQDEIKAILEAVKGKNALLMKYVDEDKQAFTSVVAAYKMSKCTEDEKKIRAQRIQQTLRQATTLPMSVAQVCLDILGLARRVVAVGNINAVSDAAISGLMAYSALHSAIYNVKINTVSIKDVEFVEEMKEQVTKMVGEAAVLHKEILAEADRLIG